MKAWIITSSVLILAVLALRWAFKGRISLRLQYALWALVLLRLLIPVNCGDSFISVMNLFPKGHQDAGTMSELGGQLPAEAPGIPLADPSTLYKGRV